MVMSNNTQLTAIALNFEGNSAPDWIQLTPQGPSIEGRDGRRWSLNDPEQIVAAFRENGAKLPIDLEHATQLKGAKGEPAPAVGWIDEIEARNGAIWGKVDWLEEGRNAVSTRAYRYISPVFKFAKASGAIARMVSAGLTNTPNLQLAALNSEDAEEEREDMDKAVLEALGLNSDASAADAVVAIGKLKEAEQTALNSADRELFIPKADHELALNRIAEFEAGEKTREDEAMNAAVDAAIEAGKVAPSSREFHLATCRANGVDAFTKMIGTLPVIAGKSGLDQKDPGAGTATALNAEEIAAADALGMSHEDFAAAKEE